MAAATVIRTAYPCLHQFTVSRQARAAAPDSREVNCGGCGVPRVCPKCTASHFLADDELEALEPDDEGSDSDLDFANREEAMVAYK